MTFSSMLGLSLPCLLEAFSICGVNGLVLISCIVVVGCCMVGLDRAGLIVTMVVGLGR